MTGADVTGRGVTLTGRRGARRRLAGADLEPRRPPTTRSASPATRRSRPPTAPTPTTRTRRRPTAPTRPPTRARWTTPPWSTAATPRRCSRSSPSRTRRASRASPAVAGTSAPTRPSPSPVPISPSSVLVNGGAEDGLAGWSGSFAAAAYGDPFLPTSLAGQALGGGARFFAGATDEAPVLSQRVDVAGGGGVDRRRPRHRDALRHRRRLRRGHGRAVGPRRLQGPREQGAGSAGARRRRHRRALQRDQPAAPRRGRRDPAAHPRDRRDAARHPQRRRLHGRLRRQPVARPVGAGRARPDHARRDPPVPGLKPFNGVSVLTAQPALLGQGRRRGCCWPARRRR